MKNPKAKVLEFKPKSRKRPPANCSRVMTDEYAVLHADPPRSYFIRNPETGAFDIEIDPRTGQRV